MWDVRGLKCRICQSDASSFLTLQECGFKPSIISYGCLINLYVKVSFPVVCSHVLQPDHRAEYALGQCIKSFKISFIVLQL